MGTVVVDNSPTWFPTLEAVQLANWCDAAAVALVCYDSVLMFPREVEYIWKKRWSFMSTFYVIVRYLGIALAFQCEHLNVTACVAVDRFVNFGAFISTVVGDVIMAMRIYAMYLRSGAVLVILIVIILARITVGFAVAIVIFGPHSGISAYEWVLSGINVCGPIVDTTSSLPLAWNILAIVVNALLFLLAVGRFSKHALDTRRMLNSWKAGDLMSVLVRDSIVYFFLNLLATILLMISIWGVPNNSTYFAIASAYTQNEAAVLIPRLVITFRENYDRDGEPSQHEGIHGHDRGAVRRTIGSGMVFRRRTVTDDFEMRTVELAQAQALGSRVGVDSA